MTTHTFLAIDLGATSGRAIVGRVGENRIEMQEIHRFANRYTIAGEQYFWDVYRLLDEIKQALALCRDQNIALDSMGVDTWGVDFGYIDGNGQLLGLPRSYRDPYTNGAPEEVFNIVSREELYMQTGIQVMNFNSIFQLFRDAQLNYDPYLRADKILFMPDLINFLLTGVAKCERTIASTSHLLNPRTGKFNRELAEKLGIRPSLLIDPITPGTATGSLLPSIAEELGVPSIPVVAVAGHDTASAVAACPAFGNDYAYLSSGTWSLIGVEIGATIINESTMRSNFTNEAGIDNTIRLLKNITGLWMLEECRREWIAEGKEYSYEDIAMLAMRSIAFPSVVDTNDKRFSNPQSMRQAIVDYCKLSFIREPSDDGEFAALIFNSLAKQYSYALLQLRVVVPYAIRKLHVIGGGSKNRLLNALTAREIGVPVVAGPSEATAIGNIMLQARAAGLVHDKADIRRIVERAFPPEIITG
jgi:rhamnulokinase